MSEVIIEGCVMFFHLMCSSDYIIQLYYIILYNRFNNSILIVAVEKIKDIFTTEINYGKLIHHALKCFTD